MPIYEYEFVLDDNSGGERFELLQTLTAAPLTHHPETGQPVRRVLTAGRVAGQWSDMQSAARLSDKKLAANGLTKYVKVGDGKYEKSAGSGPNVISRGQSKDKR